MKDEIARCKIRTEQAMHHFLRSLSHVPADKMNWSPAPTARSAFQIAAHCAGYAGGFTRIIREGKFPPVEEFLGPIHSGIDSVATVEQAEAMLKEGTADTISALDSVLPELVDAIIETPIGPTPFRFFMNIPADHLIGHAYQIDFLQTCWGDLEVYF